MSKNSSSNVIKYSKIREYYDVFVIAMVNEESTTEELMKKGTLLAYHIKKLTKNKATITKP